MEIAVNILFEALILLFASLDEPFGTASIFRYTCPTSSNCSNNSTQDHRVPLYILVLVPFPDERVEAGWDYGLQILPGARIARDFINCNHSELLPGYRIEVIESNHEACGILETIQETYINLARFAFHQECGPVVAVAGLGCSPSTVIASKLAGHNGTDIIQLSSSGSPVFDYNTTNTTYPHLWRYVSSAAIYVDTLLALMKEFGWRKVGLVQDLRSVYFNNIAKDFKAKIASQASQFELISSYGLELTNRQLIDAAVQNVKDTGVRIIFVPATYAQSTLLICRAAEEGLVFPKYQWVFLDMYKEDFQNQRACMQSQYAL